MVVTARGIEVPNYDLPARPPAERGLRGLGSLLADATAGAKLDLELIRGAAQEFRADELFWAGPTEHSQQMVARIESAIAGYAEKKGAKVPAQLLADERIWRRKRAVAGERDRLHAERQLAFPGCICLGFGGTHPRDGLTIVTTDGRTLWDPSCEVYRDVCGCPLGELAQARLERARVALLRADTQKRLARLWTDLRLPTMPDDVSFAAHPDQATMGRLLRWYDGEFDKHGVVLAGPNQRGKTTTGLLLAGRAIEDGRGVIASTVPDLIEKLTDTFHHDERLKGHADHPPQTTHAELIRVLQTVDFLLLDDLGAEKMSDYVARALFQILNARGDANAWTVITTNLTLPELAERLGQRLWGRVIKLCARVVFDGPILGPARGGLVDLADLE
jgi:DNA replication protein DnaC